MADDPTSGSNDPPKQPRSRKTTSPPQDGWGEVPTDDDEWGQPNTNASTEAEASALRTEEPGQKRQSDPQAAPVDRDPAPPRTGSGNRSVRLPYLALGVIAVISIGGILVASYRNFARLLSGL